jgi:hypothetical protein
MWRPWKNIDGASSSVPAKKKHLSADAREIVKTIYSSLLTRGLTANTAASEISDLTKIPLTTVKRITSNPIKSRRKRKDAGSTKCIDESDKDLIRRKIYTMYEEQRIPTLDALKQRLTNDDTQINCSRISLWRILSKMGFRYRTIDKRQVLMESHRLQKWRTEYITSIRKYRTEDRPIIYLNTIQRMVRFFQQVSNKSSIKQREKNNNFTCRIRKWLGPKCLMAFCKEH